MALLEPLLYALLTALLLFSRDSALLRTLADFPHFLSPPWDWAQLAEF